MVLNGCKKSYRFEANCSVLFGWFIYYCFFSCCEKRDLAQLATLAVATLNSCVYCWFYMIRHARTRVRNFWHISNASSCFLSFVYLCFSSETKRGFRYPRAPSPWKTKHLQAIIYINDNICNDYLFHIMPMNLNPKMKRSASCNRRMCV